MLTRTPEAERELALHGYNRQDLESSVMKVLRRHTDRVREYFPGANSISFEGKHMTELNLRKTVVCEKTDGVRYFLCELVTRSSSTTTNQFKSTWLLIDRRYTVRQVSVKYDLPA